VLSVGTASYPAIGGALASIAWYYPFLLPVGAIPIGLFVLLKLDNPEPTASETIREYLRKAFASIRQRQALVMFTASLMTFIILYGPFLTYIPLLLDARHETSPLMIGLLLSAASIAAGVTSSQLGRLSARFGELMLIRVGFVLYCLSLVAIPFVPGELLMLGPILLFGIAQGTNIPSIFSLLTALAPLKHRAAFMAINGMVLRLGQTLGPLIMAGVYAWRGIEFTFFAGAIVSLIMLLILFNFAPQSTPDRSH
jgi:predicted MFS family arabinose efflux permease